MRIIYSSRVIVVGILLGMQLLLYSCRDHFAAPGQILLSSPSWDHLSYFGNLGVRDVKVSTPVAAAKVGPGGKVYALTGIEKNEVGEVFRNYLAEIRPDGSIVPVFAPRDSVLSFSTAPTALVVLSYKLNERCPTLYWVRYDATVVRTMAAPCSSQNPQAISEDKVLLTSYSKDPDTAPHLLLLRGDQFQVVAEGFEPLWISQTQFLYQGAKRCVYSRSLSESASSTVLCGAIFEGAASPDGRYVVVHVAAASGPLGLKDTKELRIVDARSGRYATLYRGAPPDVFWLE